MQPFLLLFFTLFSVTSAQICNNTCGTGLVYNNRCDEVGNPPLCPLGTDCSDCQMTFPTWQIVIASISLFVLVVALVALFCFRDFKTNGTSDLESAKPTASGIVKFVGKLAKTEQTISNAQKNIETKKAAIVKAKNDASKSVDKIVKTGKEISKTVESTTEDVAKKLRPGAPKLPAQRAKIEVATA